MLMLQTIWVFHFSYFNNTPLHFATRGSNLLIVQALIASGAKIGIQNNSKETPLSSAKISRHTEIKEYLIGISTKKIQRPSLNELINKHLPILNGEEEEEEESRDDAHNRINLTDSNSFDNIKIDSKNDKSSKQLSKIYRDLKEIENRINSIKETVQIVDLNSKKYPDTSIITPPNEEDTHLNNLSKYISDLSGKINYIENTLNINQKNEEEEEEKNENNINDEQNKKDDDPKNKTTQNKNDIYDKESLQEEMKAYFPFFRSKSRCYYCGSRSCHYCSQCNHQVCPVCTLSILHINDDKQKAKH